MGIFRGLSTAVSGLRAQSFALEHISGNIANSQTTGFKRIETSFVDLVSDAPARLQSPGSVNSFSRATNTVQGDVIESQSDTHFAISGDGYFVVEERTGTVDGNPQFDGPDLYTRRGDFELDQNGFLVNGSGFYLKGLEIDTATGNPLGGVPEVIQVSRDPVPAQGTTEINYRANLPASPLNASSDANDPDSGRLNPADFANFDGNGNSTQFIRGSEVDNFINASIAGGAITAFDPNGAPVNVQLRWAKIETTGTPPPDQWVLFYQEDSTALNTDPAWRAVDNTYTFNETGQLSGSVQGTGANIQADTGISQTGDTNFVDDTAATLTSADLDNEPVEITGTVGGLATTTNLVTDLGFVAGDTISVTTDAGTTTHTVAGTDTIATLTAALSVNAEVGVALDGTGNIEATAANNTTDVTFGGTGDLALLGLDTNTVGPVNSTLVGQTGILQLTIGTSAAQTIDLSTISTVTELETALNGLAGITAVDTAGEITITATNIEDSITIAGGDASFLDNGTTDPTNATIAGLTDVFSVNVNGATTNLDLSTINNKRDLETALANFTDLSISVDATGDIQLTANDLDDEIQVTNGAGLGLTDGFYEPENTAFAGLAGESISLQFGNGATQTINFGAGDGLVSNLNDLNEALASISGGSASLDSSGNLQLIAGTAGENITVGGTANALALVGATNLLGENSGAIATNVTISAATINGVTLSDINLDHGTGGITQFADPAGTTQVTEIDQNGFAIGTLVGIELNEAGRIVANYTNGETLEISALDLVNFNAESNLRRLDGGAYEATSDSGEPFTISGSRIIGRSLESSNTDIADEFTKLIVTQQAYAANTRVVSTADEMLQEALNIIR